MSFQWMSTREDGLWKKSNNTFMKKKRLKIEKYFRAGLFIYLCNRNCKEFIMEMAFLVAERSPCLRKQVGCILIDKNFHVLATGYNGPPRDWPHCKTCKRKGKDPAIDYLACNAVHAEQNAVIQCYDTSKIDACFVTHFPCPACSRLLHNTKCRKIFYCLEKKHIVCKMKTEKI